MFKSIMFKNKKPFLILGISCNMVSSAYAMFNENDNQPPDARYFRVPKLQLFNVPVAVADLGVVYKNHLLGILWTGVTSRALNHDEALKFCESLGEGIRLPTADEWAVFGNMITIGVLANENCGTMEKFGVSAENNSQALVEEFLSAHQGKWFWTSTITRNNRDFAFYFDSRHMHIRANTRQDKLFVRCVIPHAKDITDALILNKPLLNKPLLDTPLPE